MKFKRILVVDDDQYDRELICDSIQSAGISNPIDVLTNGEEAIRYLKDPDNPKPILILLDIKMPLKSGIDVLKEAKEDDNLKDIPIVMLTSSKEDIDVYESYKYNANGYVCKPVDFSDFQEVVRRIGLYWCLSNECAY